MNFWYCNSCNAQNSTYDGTCQWCECGGAACKRDNCDGPHPCACGHTSHDGNCSYRDPDDGVPCDCWQEATI